MKVVKLDSYGGVQKIGERLDDAKIFLKRGLKEIEDGRRKNDKIMIREGCEKVFHAFVEACTARIQKYGLGIAHSHDKIDYYLKYIGDKETHSVYFDAFGGLHTAVYYRGWIDHDEINKRTKRIEKKIKDFDKKLRYKRR